MSVHILAQSQSASHIVFHEITLCFSQVIVNVHNDLHLSAQRLPFCDSNTVQILYIESYNN